MKSTELFLIGQGISIVGIIVLFYFIYTFGVDDGYKQGQLDYYKGIIKYTPKIDTVFIDTNLK